MSVINEINTDVLRNRGVMVRVHRLKKNDEGAYVKPYIRERDQNTGEYIYDQEFIKFTNWSLANIDEDAPTGFGGFEAFQDELENRPMRAMPKTIAHIFDMYDLTPDGTRVPDSRFGAALLLDAEIHEYVIACLNAMLIAQGVVSPELAAESLDEQIRELRKDKKDTEAEMRKRLLELSSEAASKTSTKTTPTDPDESQQSSASTQDGASSDVPTTSSGN